MTDFEMTEEEFYEAEQIERQKHDDMVKESKQKSLEQTAEEWFSDNIGTYDSFSLYPSNNKDFMLKAYKDGYKAGQKETDSYYQKEVDEMSDSYSERLKALQQKYDELNDFSNSQCAKLLKENADLKSQIEVLENSINCTNETFLKLKNAEEQIEKMKCCGNCKHFQYWDADSCLKGCWYDFNKQKQCNEDKDKWELGE